MTTCRLRNSFLTTPSSVAVFANTPPEAAGVVAAIFNSSLQLGCAAGIAIVTSIQTSIQATHGGPTSFVGRADGFWFLFAAVCALTVALLVFMKDTMPALTQGAPVALTPGADSEEASTIIIIERTADDVEANQAHTKD